MRKETIMKKPLLVLAVTFSALAAYGQSTPVPLLPHIPPQQHQRPPVFHDQVTIPGSPNDKKSRKVYCTQDWQQLWNGNHVRIKGDIVIICKQNDDILIKGDEVILLPTGNYLVRNGNDWRVHNEDGDEMK